MSSELHNNIILENGLNAINKGLSLPALFEKVTQIFSREVAIYYGNKAQNKATYNEIALLIQKVIVKIEQAGLPPGSHIGVNCNKSPLLFASMFAIWHCGYVYTPLEPTWPADYLRRLAEYADVLLILHDTEDGKVPAWAANSTVLSAHDIEAVSQFQYQPLNEGNISAPAILMFTSGSTGEPKGVLHAQHQVLNRLAWMWSELEQHAPTIAASRSYISVMPSMWELLGALLLGQPTIMLPHALLSDPHSLKDFLVQRRVNWITLTPSLLRLLLAACDRPLQRSECALELITLGGEIYDASLIEQCQQLFPDCRIIEDYGATEVNTIAAGIRQAGEALTFRAIKNLRVTLCDDLLQEVADGEVGEICVSGIGVALSYHRQEQRTARAFPTINIDQQPVRVYRTGDLGIKLPNGEFLLKGRKDDRVKINGQSLDLSAVENELKRLPEVKDAVVLYDKTPTGYDHLYAWVVTANSLADPQHQKIRELLQQRVPAFMLPHHIQPIETLPRLSNGKVDRRALAETLNRQTEPQQLGNTTVEQRVLDCIEHVLGYPLAQQQQRATWTAMGVDSISIVALATAMKPLFGPEFSAIDLYNAPDIETLLASHAAKSMHPEQLSPAVDDDIAIIGMAGQFPGADSITQFWHKILAAADEISEIPAERWLLDESFYSPDGVASRSKWGAFLDNAWQFDANRYGFTDDEALGLDPQHRRCFALLRMLMEDASYSRAALKGHAVGIFLGLRDSFYHQVLRDAGIHQGPNAFLGTDNAMLAGRLAHYLGTHGAAMVVDTACSSSLVALHLACQSLRSGESSMAICGGISLTLHPEFYLQTSQLNVFSPRGKCRPFDAQADGFVHGEGGALLLLKPLYAARQQGDHIWGVIKGSVVNHDGHSTSVTAPNGKAQADLLASLYQQTGISPATVGYVETHGTGTHLGDPIEARALMQVFASTERTQPCVLGTLKANIGHLTAAAGIAGVVKATLSAKFGIKPPCSHFNELNPLIDCGFLQTFQLPDTPIPWSEATRRAAVSAFGMSGTNAHCLIEFVPVPDDIARDSEERIGRQIVISATSAARLSEYLDALQQALHDDGGRLSDVAWTLAHREIERIGWYFSADSLAHFQQIISELKQKQHPGNGICTPAGKIATFTQSDLLTQFVAGKQYRKVPLPVSQESGSLYRPLLAVNKGVPVIEARSASVASYSVQQFISHMTGLKATSLEQSITFAQAGVDSLKMLALQQGLQQYFDLSVDLYTLMNETSIADLLAQLSHSHITPAVTASCLLQAAPDNRYQPFPLTDLQASHAFSRMTQKGLDGIGSIVWLEFAVANLNIDKLQHTWQQLVVRHPMLSVRMLKSGKQQIEHQVLPVTIPVTALHLTGQDVESYLDSVNQKMATRRFGIDDFPRYELQVTQVNAETNLVHFCMDAAVIDGHSAQLLLAQWHALYHDMPLQPLPEIDFRDVVLHQADKTTDEYALALRYWQQKLGVAWRPAALPPGQAEASASRVFRLTHRLTAKRYQEASQKLHTSPQNLLFFLFLDWLSQYQQGETFGVIMTLKNRPPLHTDIEQVVGPFTSSSLFLAEASSGDFARYVSRLHDQLEQDLRHYHVSAVEALRSLPVTQGVLPIVYSGITRYGAQASWYDNVVHENMATSGVRLHCHVLDLGDRLQLAWDIDTRALNREEALRYLQSWVDFMESHSLSVTAERAVQPPLAARVESFPLTPMMSNYLYQHMVHPGAPSSWVLRVYPVSRLSVQQWQRALRQMHREHPILSTLMTAKGMVTPNAVSVIPPVIRVVITDQEATTLTAACQQLEQRWNQKSDEPHAVWPGYQVFLLEWRGESYLAIRFQCLWFDGYATLSFCDCLLQLTLSDDKHEISAERDTAVFRYAQRRQAFSRTRNADSAREYWQEKLSACSSSERIKFGSEKQTQIITFPRVVLEQYAAGRALDACLIAMLNRALQDEPALRPMPLLVVDYVHRQLNTQWHSALGDFSSFCVLTPEQRTQQAEEIATEMMRDRGYSFHHPVGTGVAFPLVFTNALNYDVKTVNNVLPVYVNSNTQGVLLDCIAYFQGDDLCVEWTWPTEIGIEVNFPRTLARFKSALMRESEISPETRSALLRFNPSPQAYDREATMVSLFDAAVARYGDAVALVEDESTCSYRQLHSMSCRYARSLQQLSGTGAGMIVAIKMGRTKELVAILYAILRLGAVFVPLNDNDALERQKKMLAHAQADCVIADAGLLADFQDQSCQLISVESLRKTAQWQSGDPIDRAQAGHLAYVIFTSGSTGEPKGVMVKHRPVTNLITWLQKEYGFSSQDRGLWVNAIGFDLSIFDIFGLLATGASLRLVSNKQRLDALAIRNLLCNEPITFWNSAPAYLQMVFPFISKPSVSPLVSLRLIFLSGDWIPLSLAQGILDVLPAADLIALGGATETTVWSNSYPVTHVDPQWSSIPYGRPMPNSRYYILREDGAPCDVGEQGRLFISGECLSEGYLNAPEITAKSFVADRLTPEQTMYDTGDLARYFPNGDIEFLGRADTQVKLRGYRVELGEIAAVMKRHGYIDPVIILEQRVSGQQRLLAFCLGNEGADEAGLRNSLPAYMLPDLIQVLSTFPVTENGKVDRKQLLQSIQQ
ncbi:non-ribosomal peptide synthetase [Xenorhabdus indica]|uniref:non-ribosomal peptide synthetase n=1 Tax=Xenorhabdus indica TaxID=333964 RepID=UPI0016574DC1|nr:non-ribosomal peptide synthetase [Xenorhabdus indica]MBC8946314.1 putative hybrid polyketide-non-ribosomal peptide synthetase [Xenorhabdus indica]